VVDLGYTAEEAWAPFKRIQDLPILTFRDATYCPQDYDLEIIHCLMGIRKAVHIGWFDPSTFDQNEYEVLDDPGNADMHFLSPDFAAFKGPSARKTKLMPGVYTMTPKHYSSIFRHKGVKNVVRLNEPTSYDKAEFEKYGINHYDLYFDDCTVPPNAIVIKFLKIAESAIIKRREKVAVHCKAGLGRTGTLIAIYWMKHYGFTAHECIGWLRIVRPGSVIGPQQQYLHWAEAQLGKFKVVREPSLAVSAEESARLGLEVAAAQNARSSRRAREGHS
jgi:cell division cycle 14